MRGKFITFEGSEGCGKSTQSRLLCAYLRSKGCDVLYLREPGATKISEKVRKVLLDKKNDAMSIECEMLLYMAARAQIVAECIKPALEKGRMVICDRFLDSTIAYQGYGLGMDIGFIKSIGSFVTQGICPDLTILLDVPLKKGLKHRDGRQDRIEQRSLSYHGRVRRGYFKLAKAEPSRIRIVKIQRDLHQTQENIRMIIKNECSRARCHSPR
ncbi:MAG: dTMP kinase [Candidatus Omnitrophota bacterium]|nr:dTMP kinase [Candidatus Omnitrophota bacterium]